MISIRLSEQDYREIKSHCCESGVPNVSEFVRAATVHALGLPEVLSFPAFTGFHLTALERRLDRLDEQVTTLAERLGVAFYKPE